MIISASRRTDIPAHYSEWFCNRLNEGYVLIPNPRNSNRLSRVELSPDKVDCIVFWTKNPAPMLSRLDRIEKMGYPFYFQFTLTPYDKSVERNLPSKHELIQTFQNLSSLIGPERVVWRYDPVMITERYPLEWHLEHFGNLCGELGKFTHRCIFSFLDPYAHIGSDFHAVAYPEMMSIAEGFSKIAAQYKIPLFTCAEEIDLSRFQIRHASCIDPSLIEQIVGCPIRAKKDAGQRPACGCMESVDIGAYDTCPNGCTYCYAMTNMKTVLRRVEKHDPLSPMLTGVPRGDELVTDRTAPSQKIEQLTLF